MLKAGYNEGGDLRAVEYNEGFEFAYRRYRGLNLLKAGYNEGGDLRAVEYNEGFEFAYRRRALPQPVDQLLPKAAKPIIGPKLLFIRSSSMNSNVFKYDLYLS